MLNIVLCLYYCGSYPLRHCEVRAVQHLKGELSRLSFAFLPFTSHDNFRLFQFSSKYRYDVNKY